MKLIACAQHGVVARDPILATPGNAIEDSKKKRGSSGLMYANICLSTAPIPQFNGEGNQARLLPPNNTPDSINTEDRIKYIGIFQSLGPVDGILNGKRIEKDKHLNILTYLDDRRDS